MDKYQNGIYIIINMTRAVNILLAFVFVIQSLAFNKGKCEIEGSDCGNDAKNTQIKHYQYFQNSDISDDKNKNIISANTFYLSVLLQDEKLTFNLRDYVHWAIYQKTYTNDDIGKQLNRRILMSDIISAFCQKDNEDQQSMPLKPNKNVIKYNFGEVFNFGEKSSSFKLQKGGVVTVLTQIWTRTRKDEVSSVLKLDKVRNMNQIQIYSTKSELQKRQLLQILNNQIQGLKNQNKQLKTSLQQIQKPQSCVDHTSTIESLQSSLTSLHSQLLQLKKQSIQQYKFSVPQKHSLIALTNSKTARTESDQGPKLALVEPCFGDRFSHSVRVRVQNAAGNVGVGVCDWGAAAGDGYSSGGFYGVFRDGSVLPHHDNRCFQFNTGESIQITINKGTNQITFNKNLEIYTLQSPSEINSSQFGFCICLEKNGDQVNVQGYTLTKL